MHSGGSFEAPLYPGGHRPASEIEIVAMDRRSKHGGAADKSRSGSASSTGGMPYPPGAHDPASTGPSGRSMHAHGSASETSMNPTVGSMYPTRSAQSGVSALSTEGPGEVMPAEKLQRAIALAPGEIAELKPSMSGGPLRPTPSGVSSGAGVTPHIGSAAMASLAAQSTAHHGVARGETMSSMGIALPTSTREFSSCGVAHGSHTLGTTFDSIPVDPPALPMPTTADREAGSVMPPDLLEHALDNMSAADTPFMGDFRLLGPMERRGGGQGLVQFANQLRTGDPVAIKFFVNSRAFECERDLYSQEHLRGMMPAVSLMHSNADVRPSPAACCVLCPSSFHQPASKLRLGPLRLITAWCGLCCSGHGNRIVLGFFMAQAFWACPGVPYMCTSYIT